MNFSLHPYNKVPLWKNPHNKPFSMDFPIIEANYSTEAELHNENISIILNEMDDAQSKATMSRQRCRNGICTITIQSFSGYVTKH